MTELDILTIKNVRKYFSLTGGIFKRERARINVLNGVNLSIARGEILGLVGESGCGKSTLAKILMKLLIPSSGNILFEARSLNGIRAHDKKQFYQQVQMVFQDPYSSLNPRLKVKDILGEMLRIRGIPKEEEQRRVGRMLSDVQMADDALKKYSHEFSGGQRQRIAIARALIVRPKLLVADEPLSALDLSIQNNILAMLKDLKVKYSLTILLISHDLNLIADFCDRVAVMYLGRIVEILPAWRISKSGRHPYVRALLDSIPVSDPALRSHRRKVITGEVPNPADLPSGCAFHPRCPERFAPCITNMPGMTPQEEENHFTACHLYGDKIA
jgi:oligopeptide/dipeptide ABC transporter ATP-binding protein